MFIEREQGRIRRRYGPWAVVTGASSGIGREIALYLAGCGLSVAVVARRSDELKQLAELLRALGRRATALPGALTKFLTASLSTLPRWGRVRAMEVVMSGMTKHGNAARSTKPAGEPA